MLKRAVYAVHMHTPEQKKTILLATFDALTYEIQIHSHAPRIIAVNKPEKARSE